MLITVRVAWAEEERNASAETRLQVCMCLPSGTPLRDGLQFVADHFYGYEFALAFLNVLAEKREPGISVYAKMGSFSHHTFSRLYVLFSSADSQASRAARSLS